MYSIIPLRVVRLCPRANAAEDASCLMRSIQISGYLQKGLMRQSRR
jgi:hypothetical protein